MTKAQANENFPTDKIITIAAISNTPYMTCEYQKIY